MSFFVSYLSYIAGTALGDTGWHGQGKRRLLLCTHQNTQSWRSRPSCSENFLFTLVSSVLFFRLHTIPTRFVCDSPPSLQIGVYTRSIQVLYTWYRYTS